MHTEDEVILPHHQFEVDSEQQQTNNNNINCNINNNGVWFSDVESDFNSLLNSVDPFCFPDNILFDVDDAITTTTAITATTCLNVSSSNFSVSEISEVMISRDSSTNLFHCPHCSKSFQYSSRLQRHLTVHQSKQFKCKICDKYFSRLDVMETHVAKTHGSSSSLHSSSSSSPSNSSSEVEDWSPVKRRFDDNDNNHLLKWFSTWGTRTPKGT